MVLSSALRLRLRRAAVVGTALLGLALTGCGQAQPGVVAYVGSQQISQTSVDTAVAGLSSTLQPGQTVSTEAVVNAMIAGALAEQIAADKNIPLTDAARDAVLKGTNLAPLVNVPAAKPVAYDVADQAIVSSKLGGDEAYLAEAQHHSVKLNPRFGVLDPKSKTVLTDQSGSLSVPAPAGTATP